MQLSTSPLQARNLRRFESPTILHQRPEESYRLLKNEIHHATLSYEERMTKIAFGQRTRSTTPGPPDYATGFDR